MGVQPEPLHRTMLAKEPRFALGFHALLSAIFKFSVLNKGLHFHFVLLLANVVACAAKVIRVRVLVSQNTFLDALLIYSVSYLALRQSSQRAV